MEDHNNGLSDKQEMALELVMSGMTDGEVAKRVGVSRQWVNRWRNRDGDFMEALEMRRQMLREQHMKRLSQLMDQAIAILGEALEAGDEGTKLKTAMYVLKISGLQGYAKPPKPPLKEESDIDALTQALDEAARELGFRVG